MQFHLPGLEFAGPGTHIYTKILNNVKPTNKADTAALLHDIEYLHNHGEDEVDGRAIRNAGGGVSGYITKAGLALRGTLGMKFNNKVEDEYLDLLYDKVADQYADDFEKYQIPVTAYKPFSRK